MEDDEFPLEHKMKSPPAKLALKLTTPIHNGLTTPFEAKQEKLALAAAEKARKASENGNGTRMKPMFDPIPDSNSAEGETTVDIGEEDDSRKPLRGTPAAPALHDIPISAQRPGTGKIGPVPVLNDIQLSPIPGEHDRDTKGLQHTNDSYNSQHQSTQGRQHGSVYGMVTLLFAPFSCCFKNERRGSAHTKISPRTEAMMKAI